MKTKYVSGALEAFAVAVAGLALTTQIASAVNPFEAGNETKVSISRSGNSALVSWNSQNGVSYTVQESPDLGPNSWLPIGNQIGTGGQLQQLFPITTRAFYRVKFPWHYALSVGSTPITDIEGLPETVDITSWFSQLDDGVAVFNLDKPVRWYDTEQWTLHISDNGFFNFVQVYEGYEPTPQEETIPDGAFPPNFVAPFYRDLTLEFDEDKVLVWQHGGNVIVQWNATLWVDPEKRYKFQVMLMTNGEILFRYLRVDESDDLARVISGIQQNFEVGVHVSDGIGPNLGEGITARLTPTYGTPSP